MACCCQLKGKSSPVRNNCPSPTRAFLTVGPLYSILNPKSCQGAFHSDGVAFFHMETLPNHGLSALISITFCIFHARLRVLYISHNTVYKDIFLKKCFLVVVLWVVVMEVAMWEYNENLISRLGFVVVVTSTQIFVSYVSLYLSDFSFFRGFIGVWISSLPMHI